MNSLNKSLEYIFSNAFLRTNLVRKVQVDSARSTFSYALRKKTRGHKDQSLKPLLKHIDQKRLTTILAKKFPEHFSHGIAHEDGNVFWFTLTYDDDYEQTHQFLIDIYTVANRITIDLLSRLKTELPSAKLLHIRDTNRRVDRSLLLYQYAPHIFNDILSVERYEPPKDRRSALRCSSYTTTEKTQENAVYNTVSGLNDRVRMEHFKHAMSSIVFCPTKDIDIEVNENIGDSTTTPVYELTVIYLESVCRTSEDKRLNFYSESNQRKALYITYYKASNLIDVFSSSSRIRLDTARCFLEVFGNTEHNDLSQIVYNIQQLARFTPLPVNRSDALWAKVTKLTYADNGRTTSWSIDVHDPTNIYDTIKSTHQPGSMLTKVAEASITLKMNSPCNNRYTRIDLFGTHTCQIITTCDQDRWLCHQLLNRWALITRTPHVPE